MISLCRGEAPRVQSQVELKHIHLMWDGKGSGVMGVSANVRSCRAIHAMQRGLGSGFGKNFNFFSSKFQFKFLKKNYNFFLMQACSYTWIIIWESVLFVV